MINYFKKFFTSEKDNDIEINMPIKSSSESGTCKTSNDNEVIAVPPKLQPEGLIGILKDTSALLSKGNEANETFIASNIMMRVAASIPRGHIKTPFMAEFTEIRIFALHILPSGCGKGISDMQSDALFKAAIDQAENGAISPESGLPLYSKVFSGGLSTGEGIAYELRDSVINEKGETEPGVDDKRLLVSEAEFSGVLSKGNAYGSILSPSIRKLFDGKSLEPMTKNNRVRCTDPHVCITGHITPEELLMKLNKDSISNGFANRFAFFSGIKPIHCPFPEIVDNSQLVELADSFNEIMLWCHASPKILTASECYNELWAKKYSELKEIGATDSVEVVLMQRAVQYATMYAMLFAVLEKATVLTAKHLTASLAWIDFWHQSVRYIFSTENAVFSADKKNIEALEVLKKIQELIANNNGQPIARTPLQQAFGKKYTSKQLSDVLKFLQELPKAPIVVTKHQHNKQLISLT
ncbi:hypothetical protein HYO12_15740 [Vibrio parahaemolyticus]|nr:hypothetical protein [Vibrio parahaemolyticus]